jgi:metal-responsive CopG/Arc/MetJ family transcriptional regulator
MHSQIERRSERIAVALTPAEVEKIDEWGFSRRMRARSEVIRQLVLQQLAQQTPSTETGRAHHG